jgi:hypothetical protein
MKLEHGAILNFEDALYKAQCPKCKKELEWETNFDADGTTYGTECCGLVFSLSPHTVKAEVSNAYGFEK